MKALSIKQPWLYCITDLDKRIENRTWKPPDWLIGQRIALHASKTLDHDGKRVASELAGFKLSTVVGDMPFGAIVATAVVAGWVDGSGVATRPELTRYIGNKWFFGPFGWVLDDVRKLAVPVPCSGRLGLWDAPTAVSQEAS